MSLLMDPREAVVGDLCLIPRRLAAVAGLDVENVIEATARVQLAVCAATHDLLPNVGIAPALPKAEMAAVVAVLTIGLATWLASRRDRKAG